MNRWYAKSGGIPLAELNELEVAFLRYVSFFQIAVEYLGLCVGSDIPGFFMIDELDRMIQQGSSKRESWSILCALIHSSRLPWVHLGVWVHTNFWEARNALLEMLEIMNTERVLMQMPHGF